ncbi:O-antigen ligase family protein [methane-oxidizing endosymbiont of Gigantopelta aegis]|uniref:O-antigen ligase family protein n=1 Tax=methane-oxidizing endosymbiont of Gigantopelta aegis TaxID=2794938 RepID=UPI0018DE5535|nr:O-antigen ligase family protein [methane-oxidizing endosymbiont of Gigantopelta aegis]
MKHNTLSIGLLALISSSLFIAITYKGTGLNIINLTVSSLLLMITAAIALYYNLRQASQLIIRLPELLAILTILWLFATILWSQAPLLSFYTAWIISAFPFAFLLRGWLKPWVSDQQLLTLLLLVIGFYAFWATGEFLNTAQSTHGPMIYQGNFGALFAAGLLPVNAFYLLSPGKNGQKRYLLFTALLSIALFSTYSRGSMLSYLMTLPVLLYLANRYRQLTPSKAIQLCLTVALSFLLIYGYAKGMGGQDMADKTALTNGTIPGIGSINARIMLYQSMLKITQDYPVLGSGIGSFAAIYPQYRNPAEVSGGYFGHNDYLQFLHEGGPILLLLALLPLILIARLLRHNLQPHPQSTTPALLTGALALAAATFFIHAAADFIFYHIGLNILAGFFLALAYHSSCKPLNVNQPVAFFAIIYEMNFIKLLDILLC